MSSPRARDGSVSSDPGARVSNVLRNKARLKSQSNDDESDDETENKASLVPLAHHAVATVVYLFSGYFLWFANQNVEVVDPFPLTDHEKRLLHYQSHPTAWVKTRLPVTVRGWVSLLIVMWMAWNWARRVYRVKKIIDAQHRAVQGALNSATLRFNDVKRVGVKGTSEGTVKTICDANGDESNSDTISELNPGDALNPCSDLKCLRCRPGAHAMALSRNALKLRELMKNDPVLARNVSPDVIALASKSEKKVIETLRVKETNQAPTVFRLPHLSACPVHKRGGIGCIDVSKGKYSKSRKKRQSLLGLGGSKCACSELWGDGEGEKSDVRILENMSHLIRKEIQQAVFAKRTLKSGDDLNENTDFMPFDPAVRKGGDWSAVYLYRNGVMDRRNCEAFPAAANAIEQLKNGCFGGGGGVGGCAFGSAYISKLEPGTLITPHCGPCNARLRVSVGISVPGKVEKTQLSIFGSGLQQNINTLGKTDTRPVIQGRKSMARKVVDFFGHVLLVVIRVVTFPLRLVWWLLRFLFFCLTTLLSPFIIAAKTMFTFHEKFGASATKPTCELTVSKEHVEWQEGKAILFDDSFVHSAEFRRGKTCEEEDKAGYKPGALDSPRIVLIVDFWHPELRTTDRKAIQTLYPPGTGTLTKAHFEETEGRKTKMKEFF
tara:strand:- start:2641 stop:4626 length:1986 start_codon:yes stop_codon:yes gene_type:complete